MNGRSSLNQNLYNLFARQVRKNPSAVAILDVEREMTYGQLALRSCEIADGVSNLISEEQELIGVLMHRNVELMAGLLGVLKAGAAYFPMESSDPASRNASLLRASGCRIVIGHAELLSELQEAVSKEPGPENPVQFIDVESFATGFLSEHEAVSASADGDGDQLAYVLYTSGSTGEPKGVEIIHRNVVSLLLSSRDLLGFTASDRSLATGAIGFDITIPELYLPLIVGGSVMLHDRRLVLEPLQLADAIRRYGITMFHTGPSVWSVILQKVPDFPRLRITSTTGEAVRPEFAKLLLDRGDSVWNLYGPTETTVWACGHQLNAAQPDTNIHSSVSAPIGKPLSHLEFIVVDEDLAIVPDGERGELLIGGPSLARGYRNRPDLTQEKFVVLPDGKRYYRTGDVVIRDSNGTVHYFGRNDDQLSIRGVRIEPREVESAISSHSDITAVAATWYDASENARSIVAAVVAKRGSSVTAAELHRYAARQLPAAMVPSRFIFLDEIPITENRKIDRNAIRQKLSAEGVSRSLSTPDISFSDLEGRIALIWKAVLGSAPESPDDNFFAVGGDSLSAVSVIMQIEREFDVSLPVQLLFESPTVHELANRIELFRDHPDAWEVDALIYPLVKGGRGTPVFFCHVDMKMARVGNWDLDCPLYSIALWSRGSGFTNARSVTELAALHIEGIRAIQPSGPYRLAGYSFGAIVALEIAHQLKSNGDEVELLFLLDPSEPFHIPLGTSPQASANGVSGYDERGVFEPGHRWITRHLNSVLRRPWTLFSYVAARWTGLPLWGWISYRLVHAYGKHTNSITEKLLPRNRWPAFRFVLKRLARTYESRPYHGPAAALFSEKNARWQSWKQLLPDKTDFEFVDSHHSDMFSPPARSVWMGLMSKKLSSVSKPSPSRSAVVHAHN